MTTEELRARARAELDANPPPPIPVDARQTVVTLMGGQLQAVPAQQRATRTKRASQAA